MNDPERVFAPGGTLEYLEQARRALENLPASGGRSGLFGLADFLTQQTAGLTVSI